VVLIFVFSFPSSFTGPPPIYIGFGSIVVNDPDALTKIIFEAIALTGHVCPLPSLSFHFAGRERGRKKRRGLFIVSLLILCRGPF
jgi:hypothetical protein